MNFGHITKYYFDNLLTTAQQVNLNQIIGYGVCFRSCVFSRILLAKQEEKPYSLDRRNWTAANNNSAFLGIFHCMISQMNSALFSVSILQSIQTLLLILQLNQSLFTVLPSKPSLRPGMIITFEVYLLKGNVVNTDRVVAWGCFPVCDGTFEVIEGKWVASLLFYLYFIV